MAGGCSKIEDYSGFFAIFDTSLTFKLIYCRYKYDVISKEAVPEKTHAVLGKQF
jgi:hypothetical protein